jgi:hypothetical protein
LRNDLIDYGIISAAENYITSENVPETSPTTTEDNNEIVIVDRSGWKNKDTSYEDSECSSLNTTFESINNEEITIIQTRNQKKRISSTAKTKSSGKCYICQLDKLLCSYN